MEKPQNPNKSLESLLKDSDLSTLTKEYSEVVLDKMLDEGLMRDLPVVGGVIGGVKFVSSVNRMIASKKLYKFLFELHKIPANKRKKKIDKINNSKKYQSTVGEMIIELLERIGSDVKPEIIGRLFSAFLEDKIDYQTYLKAGHIIERIFIYDLIDVKNNYDGEYVHGNVSDDLVISGIVNIDNQISAEEAKADWEGREFSENKPNKTLTQLGELIINIGMK